MRSCWWSCTAAADQPSQSAEYAQPNRTAAIAAPRHLRHHPSSVSHGQPEQEQGQGRQDQGKSRQRRRCAERVASLPSSPSSSTTTSSSSFPPTTHPCSALSPSGSLQSQTRPCFGIDCFHRGIYFHCNLPYLTLQKHDLGLPLWPQSHWPPCVPLIESRYCTTLPRATLLRVRLPPLPVLPNLRSTPDQHEYKPPGRLQFLPACCSSQSSTTTRSSPLL